MAAPSNPVYPSPNAADFGAAVTPSDSTNLSQATRALYVGGAGDVVVVFAADSAAVTFTGVPAGTILPVRAIRVTTSTTATSIVALW